jgi:hypothetical protein
LYIIRKIIELGFFEELFLSSLEREILNLIKPSLEAKISSNLDEEKKIIKDLILDFNPVSETDNKILELFTK